MQEMNKIKTQPVFIYQGLYKYKNKCDYLQSFSLFSFKLQSNIFLLFLALTKRRHSVYANWESAILINHEFRTEILVFTRT